jgi:isoleucyl-tRNA synthetase
MAQLFTPLPNVPDHPALEREVLERWERERTFERLRELNAGNPPWSFFDGPKTANLTTGMGVHHLWGRTYKDLFQRYKALRGFDERFQNGFDCQGLWVEVKVERDLGLNSKREIEEYGLAEFAYRCRELVAESARVITAQSIRLGQWADWGNDYYTFSDTNMEYIWRFLQTVRDRGWLYQGNRSTEWCPRCGTSLSQHELSVSDVYQDKTDPSLFVRFPLKGRDAESLVVWTTTPWTLPANVAAAVNPEAEYGKRDTGEWVAVARYPEDHFVERVPGSKLVGLEYEGPYDHIPATAGIVHRVIPWDEVSLAEGTGIVHIAPGAGTEDFELSQVHDLPVLVPVDESGRFYPDYGWLHGSSTVEAADQIVGDLRERGLLEYATTYVHRYAHCWRCSTPVIFRVVDDWFIAVDELRPKLIAANEAVDWTPDFYGKRMDDWLRNMGDWNISRKRYFGLPLPFYPCSCGHLTVVGSKAELEERALRGLEQLEEMHRPWIDEVVIACEQCGDEVRRIPEVGDVWLDAGIVPFSTLGWHNDTWVEGGGGTGAARGLTGAPLPDHAYWEKWFPADWVTEMREQIRLWFYSQLFMSVVLEGRAPFERVLGHEDVRDEHGHEMHGSKGNTIEASEALERMGADVMRWMYCAQAPTQSVKFGYAPAAEIKRRLLTLWNSAAFLITYANIEGFRPDYADAQAPPATEHLLDRWLVARTGQLVAETTDAYERYWTPALIRAFDAFVDDLSNWYIRRSRKRFYSFDEDAFRTLWHALVQALRVIAPVTPFLADHLWRNLVAEAADGSPDSVHLAGWAEAGEPDAELLAEMAEVRRVVELGRQARSQSGIKLRQPLRRLVVQGADDGAASHVGEIAEELSVKEVEFGPVGATELRVKPNLPLLGPKLGKELGAVRTALEAGDFEELGEGRLRVQGHELLPEEVLVERRGKEGWAVAGENGLTVALDLALDAELELEGRARELIHRVNGMRKDAGLELTDRIVLTLPDAESDLLGHADRIKDETLAVRIETDDASAPSIAKA